MAIYRYYFLDRVGRVAHALNFEASSDERAIATARALLNDNADTHAIEVWDVGRRLKIARRARAEGMLELVGGSECPGKASRA